MTVLFALQPLVGLALMVALAWAVSERRRRFPWRTAAAGLALQFALALLLLQLPGSQYAFSWISEIVAAVLQATEAGTSFVFGFIGGAPLPYDETSPGGSFIFALRILPMIIVVSSISAVLYHYKILPWLVRGFAWVLGKALRTSGAASFSLAANVFIGMVDSPLLIRPYLERMSRSELFLVMTGGMATVAGTAFALYATILSGLLPDAAGHILTASIISAPAAVVIAHIMSPPSGEEESPDQQVTLTALYENWIDAITRGAIDGLRLIAYIIAMLIVLLALVELVNIVLGLIPDAWGAPLTLQRLLGWALAPAAWALGLPWSEAVTGGQLLGSKIVLNELVAYINMGALPEGSLSERSSVILTYALCGFANFGSVGIMLGGIGALVPSRRLEIAQLGLKSIIAGSIATAMTGAIAGLLYW